MKEVKKEVKSKNFYLMVYDRIKIGNKPKSIAEDLFPDSKNPMQRLQYYLNQFSKEGIIAKKGYGVWEVKKEVKDFSVGTRVDKPKTNLHALNIKFPILKGIIKDDDWEVKEKLKNWLPKYKNLHILGGLTIKNNNNKSITVQVHSRDIHNVDEVDELARKVQAYLYEYFRKDGIILDILGCEVKNINLATEDKEVESMRHKGERFELDLNKKAEKIFPKDNMDGKAWIDGSPFRFSAETNDKKWKELYLTMPFDIHNLYALFGEMSENIALFAKESASFGEHLKSHTELIQSGTKLNRILSNKLSQKKLGEWQ